MACPVPDAVQGLLMVPCDVIDVLAMNASIEKLVYGGDGLAFVNGRPAFVPYSAPGDEVEIEVVDAKADYDICRIKKILRPSKCRIEAPCPYFMKCGGCQWQHISYEAQLDWKRKIVEETWKRIAKREVRVADVIPSPKKWNYRNRIQLHVDDSGNVGFHAASTHAIVNIERCLIADERINEELKRRREQMRLWKKGLSLKVDDEREGKGSFAQVNTLQNENLKKHLRGIVMGANVENVLELYAGGGNLTFAFANDVKKVFANDIDKRAVKGGNERAKELGFENVEFVWGTAEAVAKRLKEKIDMIVLDPPRTGAAKTIEHVVELGPKWIVYVSCNPTTLARDSNILFENGYSVEKCDPMDMFPQTYHVESVTVLKRQF